MKNKAEVFTKQDAVVTWYKVQLFGAYEGKWKARLIEYSTIPFTDFEVYADYELGALVTNSDLIDLVKEAINNI
jgi:hypothetical protein